MAQYVTSFATVESPISEGGRWLNGQADGRDWSNVFTDGAHAHGAQITGAGNARFNDSTALLKGAWSPDQSVECVLYKGSMVNLMNPEVEFRLRSSLSAGLCPGYEIDFSVNQTYLDVVRWNGPLGDYTVLSPSYDNLHLNNGDILKASITGSIIRVWVNGALILTVVDSTITAGQPGIGFFHDAEGAGEAGFNSQWGFSHLIAEGLMATVVHLNDTPMRASFQEWSGPGGSGSVVPPTGAVSYTSSNSAVATVNSSTGQLAYVSTGTTTITGADAGNSMSASAALQVDPPVAVSATLTFVP